MSTHRDRNNFSSHPSGYEKRLKKEKKEQFINKQRGSFDKFLSNIIESPNKKFKNDNTKPIAREIQQNNILHEETMDKEQLVDMEIT